MNYPLQGRENDGLTGVAEPVFLFVFLVLAWWRRIEWPRRLKATAYGVAAIGLILPLVLHDEPDFVSLRHLLPMILIPMAYWQTGQFTAPLNERLQKSLAEMDRRIFGVMEGSRFLNRIQPWPSLFGEYAYIFCYPMVPSGLAV